MRKRLKLLVITILVLMIITGVGAYTIWMVRDNEAEEYVTGEKWASSTWSVEAPSYAETSNGSLPFRAMTYQPSEDTFGASLIQQGDSPHGWWYPKEKLKREITISKDEEQHITLEFRGTRTSDIEWFTSDPRKRFNNIGVLLVGDIGKDYYNPDTEQPRALFIDIWLDTNPVVSDPPTPWQGVDGVENDYHSGYPVQTMSEIGKEYEFKVRIDPYVRDSLNYWKLEWFKLKMVQCYIEAKASKASMEVSRVLISTS